MVQIPTTCISMHLILQGFNIPLAAPLKPGHRLVLELSHFNVKFMNKEPFHVSHLQGMDPKCDPAHVLSFIQLHTRAFFVEVPNADTLAEAAAVPVPGCGNALKVVVMAMEVFATMVVVVVVVETEDMVPEVMETMKDVVGLATALSLNVGTVCPGKR